MSLVTGGIFDLNENYLPPHADHRVGTNVDVGTWTFTSAQLKFIQDEWEVLGGDVHDETRTNAPHYHFRF